MSVLHKRHSGVRGLTDVLTFDLGETPHRSARGAARRVIDAEIVVCADVAWRAASVRRRSGFTAGSTRTAAVRELILYVTHGILHLAGYEDHTPSGYHRMHVREDELLAELGIGPVFAVPIGKASRDVGRRARRK